MSGATSALYEPLIERDLEAIPAAARVFVESHSEEELWIAVARFAVLAYAPSQHSKRAVMAARAAYEIRTFDLIVECARYAAESRQPWSEPPILEPPEPDATSSLQDAIASGDRLLAERWLSAHLDDAEVELREAARGDALLMLDAALALEQTLGKKGRFALLRMVTAELFTPSDHPGEPLEALVERAIASNGAIDDVRAVFIAASGLPPLREAVPVEPYRLARDYAQTLIAHSVARTLPSRADDFLRAVHHNLEHGESFAEWSFA
jgi:hypothetical protein